MKVVYIRLFESYYDESVPAAMRRLGWEVDIESFYTPSDFVHDDKLQQMVSDCLHGKNYDFAFTVNFWPVLAPVLDDLHIPYVSWSYDAPLQFTGTDEMERDNNFIFLFDRGQVRDYKARGITRVFHLPLGVDVPTFEKHIKEAKSTEPHGISFIGSFYSSPYVSILGAMDEYHRGLLEGIFDAQKNLFGYYILPELITDNVVNSVNDRLNEIVNNPGNFSENIRAVATQYASQINKENLMYAMATRITCLDRLTLVAAASKVTDTFACTDDSTELSRMFPDVTVHGRVDYYKEMPAIFKNSRINLCPTLRCIKTGIPLRALDIMACHGVVLMPSSEEAYELLSNGEDALIYSSNDEAFELMKYYTEHDGECELIKQKAYEKIVADFSMTDRLEQIYRIVRKDTNGHD